MDSSKSQQAPFRLLTAVVLAATLVPSLFQRGMFIDGVTYATISRNLAEGVGSWWAPSYTETLYPQFFEHLPLVFWLQSLAFRVLGDHVVTERVYSLVAALLTAWLITRIWNAAWVTPGVGSAAGDAQSAGYGWAPVLVWASVPFVVWGTANNMLEVSVALFSTWAVLMTFRAMSAETSSSMLLHAGAAGLATVAALFSKSPVGLFPLLLPPLVGALARPRVSRIVLVWALMGTFTLAIVGLLLLWEAPHHYVDAFLNQQLWPAIAGQREVANDRFGVVRSIVYGIGKRMLTWPAVLLLAMLAARRWPVLPAAHARKAACFLGMALLSSLPIMISRKQATHYLIPSVPFYAMAVAAVCLGSVRALAESMSQRTVSAMAFGMKIALPVALSLAVLFGPRLGRDRARIEDIETVSGFVPAGSTIGMCPEMATDWGLHAYFARFQRISLDWSADDSRTFFLSGPAGRSCAPATSCRELVVSPSLVLSRCDGQ
jgi:4-amino-4-deoxy-L-arabinose transferase-like glycosyltransferase